MRKLSIILLMCCVLALSGCDKEAQEYAKQLGEVLNSYQAQVDRKINAEQETYKRLTAFYVHAQEEELFFNLALERNRRARDLAEDYINGKKTAPTGSGIRALLKEYAQQDFDQTRVMLEDESEASTRFLANLEDLEIESEKIESLGKMLEELSKPKRPLRQLKEFVEFATKVDGGIQKLACDDLAKEIKCTEAQISNEKDPQMKKVLEENLARLKAEMETKKCTVDMSAISCPS